MFHLVPIIIAKTIVNNMVQTVGMPPWSWVLWLLLLLLMVKGFAETNICVVKLAT